MRLSHRSDVYDVRDDRSLRPTYEPCAHVPRRPSDTGLYTPPTVLASHLLAAVAGDRGRRWRPRSSADRTAVRRDQAWREELGELAAAPGLAGSRIGQSLAGLANCAHGGGEPPLRTGA